MGQLAQYVYARQKWTVAQKLLSGQSFKHCKVIPFVWKGK